jgi:hypothetical protein
LGPPVKHTQRDRERRGVGPLPQTGRAGEAGLLPLLAARWTPATVVVMRGERRGPRHILGWCRSTKCSWWRLGPVRGGPRKGTEQRTSEKGRFPTRWSMTTEEWQGASMGPGASLSNHGSARGGPWPLDHALPHRRWTWRRWSCDTVARSDQGWVRWVQQGEAEVVVCSVWPMTNKFLRTTSWL